VPKALVEILTAPTLGSGVRVTLPAATVATLEVQSLVTTAFMNAGARYVNVTPTRTVTCGKTSATKAQAATLALQGVNNLGYDPSDVTTNMKSITDAEYTALFG
jgi:hypothetical protein